MIRRALVALCAMAMVPLAACGGDEEESILDKDTLRIGVRYGLTLLSEEVDGEFVGYEIDVANYIAEQLGKDVVFVPIELDEREPKLLSGEIDLAIATYSITQERKQSVAFAGPYVIDHFDLLVRADNDEIATLDDLEGGTVCEVEGSNAIDRLTEEHGVDAVIRSVESYEECMGLVGSGEVDAIATDELGLAGLALDADFEAKLVGARFSQERIGVGMRPGDTAGCEAVNRAITEMYQDGPDGSASTAELLLEQWFAGTVLGDLSRFPIPQFEGCE
ncbi:transporter substrate-binding domain-containing protein [Glycomyces tenuis]|uniref:transporter substrate-binding domain-containing protein n=1 Tax=Glycomyces tenuis TaxID=58116 RepID=UPI000685DCB0|nr:transporter substrate-binding domain-containing protein [Glycomyces tenuis]